MQRCAMLAWVRALRTAWKSYTAYGIILYRTYKCHLGRVSINGGCEPPQVIYCPADHTSIFIGKVRKKYFGQHAHYSPTPCSINSSLQPCADILPLHPNPFYHHLWSITYPRQRVAYDKVACLSYNVLVVHYYCSLDVHSAQQYSTAICFRVRIEARQYSVVSPHFPPEPNDNLRYPVARFGLLIMELSCTVRFFPCHCTLPYSTLYLVFGPCTAARFPQPCRPLLLLHRSIRYDMKLLNAVVVLRTVSSYSI